METWYGLVWTSSHSAGGMESSAMALALGLHSAEQLCDHQTVESGIAKVCQVPSSAAAYRSQWGPARRRPSRNAAHRWDGPSGRRRRARGPRGKAAGMKVHCSSLRPDKCDETKEPVGRSSGTARIFRPWRRAAEVPSLSCCIQTVHGSLKAKARTARPQINLFVLQLDDQTYSR